MSAERSQAVIRMLEGLRGAGLKLTPQRLAIVDAFADDESHPTAQEIFERLRIKMPTMSFATVYSTLDTLAAAGLCSVRALSPGAARFDPHVAPHHHAVCDRCGAMRDVSPLASPSLAARGAARRGTVAPSLPPGALEGFCVRAVEAIYRGVCGRCAAEASASAADGSTALPGAAEGEPR